MSIPTISVVCERARFQISAALDAEASELDRRLVVSHLARCAECRAFAESVGRVTAQLREAPLDAPSTRFVLPRRQSRRVLTVAAAEYGAAAMLLIAVLGTVSQVEAPDRRGRISARPANLFQPSWLPEQELAQIQPVEDVRTTERPGPLPAL